jgi:hypothetical protein
MGFGLPDSSARALAGAGSSVDALARVIELPLARPETISPELALVDPELAQLARARLHEPGLFWPGGPDRRPTPLRATAPAQPPSVPLRADVPAAPTVVWGTPLRTAPPPAVSVAAAELLAERTAVSRADRFFQPPPPRPLVPGGMAAVAAALLVGVGGGLAWVLPEPTSTPVQSSADTPPVVSLTPGRVSADPPSVTPTSKQPATPATKEPGATTPGATTDVKPKAATSKPIPVLPPPAPSPPPASAPATATEARTFAWAPAPGAAGYEVQLFRGDDRVLVERTDQTRLKIGPKWSYEGRPMTLAPGRYRWYVWPLDAGGTRSDAPVVQARVLIGAG